MIEFSAETADAQLEKLRLHNIENTKDEMHTRTESLAAIQERMDHAPFLPTPKYPTDYPQAVKEYFRQNSDNPTIEFQIPLVETDADTQQAILVDIGEALQNSTFEYCQDFINSIPEEKRMLVQLQIGEILSNIRHSRETNFINSIYINVKKETGHVFINIINPSNYDPDIEPTRAEGGTLLVPSLSKMLREEDNIEALRTLSKIVLDPFVANPEIVGTDSTVKIELPKYM